MVWTRQYTLSSKCNNTYNYHNLIIYCFSGVNSQCVDGMCDCIRNGSGECVAYPPDSCTPPGDNGECGEQFVCNSTTELCLIPDDNREEHFKG